MRDINCSTSLSESLLPSILFEEPTDSMVEIFLSFLSCSGCNALNPIQLALKASNSDIAESI
ncbi:hypothetical protein R83H12_02902 [Fibrobacteria bacterium R8-3-H12]